MEIKGNFLFSIQLAISSELSPIAHRLIPTEIEGDAGSSWCGSYVLWVLRGVGLLARSPRKFPSTLTIAA